MVNIRIRLHAQAGERLRLALRPKLHAPDGASADHIAVTAPLI